LACAKAKRYDDIQKELNISRPLINKWKGRYKKHGLAGLKDLSRPGKPPIYDGADKARVIQLACSRPGGGYTNWSQRRISRQAGNEPDKGAANIVQS
jgi:transposase